MKSTIIFEDSPGKKVLMTGNQAFARGIIETGIKFSANYPGTPMSEVGDFLFAYSKENENFVFDYAVNEKVAFESCVGASWAGVRSAVLFKHVGLNVAADPLHTVPYSGVNGGFLIISGGDPAIKSSTNAQDNRIYSLHTKIPIIEPSNIQECKDFVKKGIELSESYKIPVMINVTARLCHSTGIVTLGSFEKIPQSGFFKKEPRRFLNDVHNAIKNQENYFKKIESLSMDEKIHSDLNVISTGSDKSLIITSGICYSYVVEACKKAQINPSIYKLGIVFPLNSNIISRVISESKINNILIVEELEPFIENLFKQSLFECGLSSQKLNVIGKRYLPVIGELNTELVIKFFANFFKVNSDIVSEIEKKENFISQIVPNLPVREATFCPGCPYRPVYYALKKAAQKIEKSEKISTIYGGDIGCYTLGSAYPFQLMDWLICMGAGIGISNGMAQVLEKDRQHIVAFIGDSTFFHAGLPPVLNAVKNGLDITLVVFNNYWTAMTGHQPHAGVPEETGKSVDIVKILKSFDISDIIESDAQNIKQLERIFSDNFKKSGFRAIIVSDECALVKERRKKTIQIEEKEKRTEYYYQIEEECVKCNECIENWGCPSIDAIQVKEITDSKSIKDSLQYYIDEGSCIKEACGLCKEICPNGAIRKTIINPHLESQEKKKEIE